MPIVLSAEEMRFVERVRGYCEAGLTQPQMATRESISLTGLRDKLRRCGLEFATRTERDLVRVRTGEPIADLLSRGEVVVSHEAVA